ncbi:coiled-coil domain-containing protein 42 homolog isoform X2 [Littorina saxatilis]|uniref:coiled-coil domain-containing protein 42 homolog isoform X2 n=1 Tax=Littorina saxatilis TaxID=31220 RepID=UPI0038B5D61D
MDLNYDDQSALEDYFKHTFQKKLLLYMPQREKEHLTPATQILEKRRELEEVEKARKAEKEEFRMKMESLAARRDEIEIRENQLKESLLKFDTFIKENDAKLTRARNKANREREAIYQKEHEIDCLLEEKQNLEWQLCKLKHHTTRYDMFHEFLRVVMAEGGGYDEPRAVMTRHKTLTSLLVQLRVKEKLRNAMLEAFRRNMAGFREEMEDVIMRQHNTISKLQKKHELANAKRLHWENEYNQAVTAASEKTMLEGKLRMCTTT